MTTTAPTATDWYTTEFAAITATPYPSVDRPTYATTGHANPTCPAIKGTAIPAPSVAAFAEANEHWDGEVEYLTPWPCPTCVGVRSSGATIAFEAPRPAFGNGPAAPRPEVEVDPQAAADLAEARAYVAAYTGTFEFLVDMKGRRSLTPKMVAAILRCKARDRSQAPAPTATPAAPQGDEDARRATLAPNAYAGSCRSCKGDVAANAGRREKADGRWTVLHSTTAECVVRPAPQAPQAPAAPLPDVPAGHYAVETEEGHLAFYRVDRPTEGRWAGRTFVAVQASDEYHPVRGNAAAPVLAKIAADPVAAMLRYGVEIGRCGHCHRTLTDETSRSLGIGPVCRAAMGLDSPHTLSGSAKARLRAKAGS